MTDREAASFLLTHLPVPSAQRVHLYCEPVGNDEFQVGWCRIHEHLIWTERVRIHNGVVESLPSSPVIRAVESCFLCELPSVAEQLEVLRREVRESWDKARAAGGQTEAFRILERMVDRVGYGRNV